MPETINSPEEFTKLKAAITRLLAFDCALYSNPFLVRRVDVRLRATGIKSYDEYAQLIETQPDERGLLARELTIHTTNFFRDAEAWEVFRKDVIPHVVAAKRAQNDTVIKVWCAGCSTGEEPLTVAVCFLEALGERLGGLRVSILATDLDAETVARAREGIYEEPQFREMPTAWRDRYFSQAADGTFTPGAQLSALITYRVDDIFSPRKPKGMDIIICRNTVIYFDMESKKRVYEEMFDCLQPGGFFMMGKTETMMGPARERFRTYNMHERLFIRD